MDRNGRNVNRRPPPIAPDTRGIRFGPFWLVPGIRRLNAVALLFGGFSTVILVTFITVAQPFVLEAVVGVPREQQGALTGWLASMQEGILVLLVGLMGAISDRIGRRIVYVAGLGVIAGVFVFFPLAGSQQQLFVLRAVYALGFAAATVMMHTSYADYSQETSRGRWMGLAGFLNGIGAFTTGIVLAQLPHWFNRFGLDDRLAIRYSFWVMAGYALLVALVLRAGLSAYVPVGRAPGAPPRDSLLRMAIAGLLAARGKPRLILAYATAFASRGDLIVITGFMSLWIQQAGKDAGLSPGAAASHAGMMFALTQALGLLWGPIMGVLLDRVSRLTIVCVAFGTAATAYFVLGQVTDPFGAGMIPATLLIGLGEGGAMVSSAVLLGQEAPASIRGAVLGASSLVAALGYMLAMFVGGQLFDHIGGTAPFTMMGCVNLAVFAGAVLVRWRAPGEAAQRPATNAS